MNKFEIDVMSRAEMDRRLRAGEIPGGSAIISISTPEVSYRPLPFHLCDKCVVLEEQFDDVDTKRNDLIPMSAEDAARVVNFVNANKGKPIFVHCDAGQSRSAGVAAAISKFMSGEDDRFFRGIYTPNMNCYSKVLSAFYDTL